MGYNQSSSGIRLIIIAKNTRSSVVRGIVERPVLYVQHGRTIQFNFTDLFSYYFTSHWNQTANFCVDHFHNKIWSSCRILFIRYLYGGVITSLRPLLIIYGFTHILGSPQNLTLQHARKVLIYQDSFWLRNGQRLQANVYHLLVAFVPFLN